MKIVRGKYCLSSVIIISVFLVAQSLFAQPPQVASSSFSIDFSKVNTLWFQALELLQDGNFDEAKLTFLDLNLAKLELGQQNLSAYSKALIQKAREFKQRGMADRAVELLNIAQMLSPELSSVYFALARLRFGQNFIDFHGVVNNLWKGLKLKFTDPRAIITYVNNGLTIVLIAGILASVIFLLSSFIYYRRAIFYQMKEELPVDVPVVLVHLIAWILIGGITLGVGIAWGILLLALLLIWHLEPSSKAILQVVLVFGAIVAILFIVVGITFSTFDGEYFQTLADISRGEFSSNSVAVLQEWLQNSPEDVYAIFGLGFIAQKNGKMEEATEAYLMMPYQYADWARVQNNLGNLYQQQYRQVGQDAWYQKAEDAYDDAIRNARNMFEPHYNYAQLLLLKNESEEAGDEIRMARDIDYQSYTRYSEYVKDNILTVETSFSTLALLKRLFYQDFFQAGTEVTGDLWRSWSRFRNPWYFSIACGVVLVASFIFGKKKNAQKQGVLYCQMCGDPYMLKRQKKAKEPEKFCTQCTYIFKKKTVVKPEKRTAKIKQIQLRQKIRGLFVKILSLFFPGAGQIYFGYYIKGILIAFVFYLGALYFLLKEYLRILLEIAGTTGWNWRGLIFFGFLLVGSYLFNIYDVLNLSPKNQ